MAEDQTHAQPEDSDPLVQRLRARMPPANEQAVQRNQLEDFMASTGRMLDLQRRRIMDAENTYQSERTDLLNRYRVKVEDLKYEAEEALRELDEAHHKKAADAKRLLDRLATMRNMPL